MPVFIDHKNKTIFVTSFKCAFTTLFKLFDKYYGLSKEIFITSDAEILHYADTLNYDYAVIKICRNPYDRLVSGFLNRVVRRHGGEITFRNFVKQLLNGTKDQHFCKQYTHLSVKSITATFIDIGQLNQIINSIYKEEIFANITKYDLNNKSCCDTTADDLLSNGYPLPYYFYDEEITSIVHSLYLEDFQYFDSVGIHYRELKI